MPDVNNKVQRRPAVSPSGAAVAGGSGPRRLSAFVCMCFVALGALGLLSACATHEKYAYLSDAPRDEEMPIVNNYSSTIFPGDWLYIHVSSNTPEAVLPFNEETNKAVLRSGRTVVKQKSGVTGYEVGPDGAIQFPVLGKVKAEGLTYEGLARDIEARLVEQRYVKDPVVTVELKNFHVTVIGEVARPGILPTDGTRLTIFEALARCGDVTMDGVRSNVTIVRFGSGADSVTVDTVDLTSKSVLSSPCYYLRQGDIVYVEPTPRKKKQAYRNEEWPHYISISGSALRVAYILVYRYAYNPKTRVR